MSRLLTALSLSPLLAFLGWPALAAADSSPEISLLDVQCETAERGALVRIILSEAAEFKLGSVSDPDRLFLDFPGVLHPGPTRRLEITSPLLRSVRSGQCSEDPLIARVVIELPTPVEYRTKATANGRIVLVELGEGLPVPESAEAQTRPSLSVRKVTAELADEQTVVVAIECSDRANYRVFFLHTPPRVVVDIQDASLEVEKRVIPTQDPLIERIRLGQFNATTVRVVFDLKELAGYLVERGRNPDRLIFKFGRGRTFGRVVVVDAGHGGHDPGCAGYVAGLWEKAVNLDLALRVARLLRGAGLVPMLTRSEDVFLELQERTHFANTGRANLFVSIHCNAMPASQRGTRCGIEVYYYTEQSEAFARVMKDALVKATGCPDRGVRQRMLYVVHHTVMPSVLVEVGYLDHPTEGRLLNTDQFRQQVAQGIFNGIKQYLEMQWGARSG